MQTHEGAAAQEKTGWWVVVQESVKNLQFGVVQIVVHNGRVVQIEKTEKVRLEPEHK